ncbi:MAG: MotA/TolQ/ExbB proton channel family protein [Alphaproteobacteria bacterium]|nr:MotA/TolQ/ExbB proton channel family protein [Alphaproteobacteria bacterium]
MEHFSFLPDSLSFAGPFVQAGPVVKTVLLALLLASILCWVWIIEGLWMRARLNRALRRACNGDETTILAAVTAAGRRVADRSDLGLAEKRTRATELMTRAARNLLMRAEAGLPNLAVISSVSPFIGLFGTVWGIMTSFAGIADAHDTSLAVVAPGIAEALAATAWGLGAAIPASIGYNRIGALFSRTAIELDDFVQDEVDRLMTAGRKVCESEEARP